MTLLAVVKVHVCAAPSAISAALFAPVVTVAVKEVSLGRCAVGENTAFELP